MARPTNITATYSWTTTTMGTFHRCARMTPRRDPETGLLLISETVDLCNITYSRERTIAAFRSYYDFLTKMYIDSERVVQPPEGGWPEITLDSMRGLGKTNEVVELLRYLPYVQRPSTDDEIHVAGWCQFADWSRIARGIANSPDPPNTPMDMAEYYSSITHGVWDNVPAHVIGLADSQGYKLFSDTHLGVIYFPGGVYTPGPTRVSLRSGEQWKPIRDDPYEYAPEEEAEAGWRGCGADDCAWAITDFFELLKYHFRELNYVPVSRTKVEEDFDREPGCERWREDRIAEAFPRVREIFREHGWPTLAQYQKELCIEAVERHMEEHCDRIYG